jgi:flagella basal body P-ring formation protein FlgA
VVRRGELVTVHCVSGGIVVKAKARARAEARQDEVIELQMDGSKKTFRARIVGPGRAVVNLDQQFDAQASVHDPKLTQEKG